MFERFNWLPIQLRRFPSPDVVTTVATVGFGLLKGYNNAQLMLLATAANFNMAIGAMTFFSTSHSLGRLLPLC